MTDTAPGGARRVAVVVVHGIGKNEPGSTVNYVVESLGGQTADQHGRPIEDGRRLSPEAHNQVHTFPEPDTAWQQAVLAARRHDPRPPGEGEKESFTVYGRGLSTPSGTTATFYELHWADIARTGTSWWDTIKGFARFVFEIPHVIDGFLHETPGILSLLLRRLLLLATCFVRGPLAGYSLVMLTGALIYMSFGWVPDREEVLSLVGLKPEVSPGLVSLLPSVIATPLQQAIDRLPDATNTRTTMIGMIAVIFMTFAMIGVRFRDKLPIVCLAIFACGSAAFYLTDILWLRPERYPHYAGMVYVDYLSVMLFGLMIVGLYTFYTRRTKEVGFADLGLSVAAWSLFFILHLSVLGDAVRIWLFDRPTLIETSVATPSSKVHFDAFAMFYPYLTWLWAVWAVLMALVFLLALVVFVVHGRHWGDHHRGIFAAIALAVAQACVWLTVVPAVGVMHMDDVLCSGSRNYATMKQPVSCQSKLQWNGKAVELIHRLAVQEPQLIEKLPAATRDEIGEAVRDRFPHTLNFDMLKAMRQLAASFVWHGFILVAAGSIAVLVAIFRHVRSRRTRLKAEQLKLPRLIISNWVLAALLAFGIVNIGLCLAWVEGFGVLEPVLQLVGLTSVSQIDVPAEVVQMALLVSTGLFIVAQLPIIMTPLTGVLQMMQGLIDHHYRTRVSLGPRLMGQKSSDPIRRNHIGQRLKTVVERLIVGQGYDEVVLLSHSQGSVILFDFLKNDGASLGVRVHVLTGGSPLGAIYAYYFNEYGRMPETLQELAPCVASWTNLYRSDDPIAGPILPASTSAKRTPVMTPAFPFHDVEMKPGGHLGYWKEPVVCDVITNLLDGRPAVSPDAGSAPSASRWRLWRWRRPDRDAAAV